MPAPKFKVYDEANVFQGAAVTLGVARGLVVGCGAQGWTVRFGHSIKQVLWTEGEDGAAKDEACIVTMGDRMKGYVSGEKKTLSTTKSKAPVAPSAPAGPKQTVTPKPKSSVKPRMSKTAAKRATVLEGGA